MELYHALNRGVDGRDIFLDDRDYLRFIHDLYEFNDAAPADPNIGYRWQSMDIVSPYVQRERTLLVEIHGWCLMKNHYHLLLSELEENGMALFLRKLNVGYARYFNERHARTGTLMQGRTKKVLIDRAAHFNYILHYIHLNPLDYFEGAERWRERNHHGIQDARAALEYLAGYRWSSYRDYAGQRNFPSILTTRLFDDSFDSYHTALTSYVNDAEIDLTSLVLE